MKTRRFRLLTMLIVTLTAITSAAYADFARINARDLQCAVYEGKAPRARITALGDAEVDCWLYSVTDSSIIIFSDKNDMKSFRTMLGIVIDPGRSFMGKLVNGKSSDYNRDGWNEITRISIRSLQINWEKRKNLRLEDFKVKPRKAPKKPSSIGG